MGLPISIVILGAMAAATLYVAIVQIFRLHGKQGLDLEELHRRSEQLHYELDRLPEAEGKERLAACRAIAKVMRWESLLLMQITSGWFQYDAETNPEIRAMAVLAWREAWELRRMITRILFLMRFRPSLLHDCHRLREAALQFCRMWSAFSRLCQVQFPDEFGNLELPEL